MAPWAGFPSSCSPVCARLPITEAPPPGPWRTQTWPIASSASVRRSSKRTERARTPPALAVPTSRPPAARTRSRSPGPGTPSRSGISIARVPAGTRAAWHSSSPGSSVATTSLGKIELVPERRGLSSPRKRTAANAATTR